MFLKRIKGVIVKMFIGANIATIVLMLLVGYSDRLNPTEHPMLANLGLIFPAFLVVNLFFLLFWVLFHPKGVIVPVIGFILGYVPIRTYIPINRSAEVPEGAIRLLSYNVKNYDFVETPEGELHPAVKYVIESGADLVCLQESYPTDDLKKAYSQAYPYIAEVLGEKEGAMMLLSKYPIRKAERIPYTSKGNLSAAFTVDYDGGDVLVVNNHFETSGLNMDDRKGFGKMVKGNVSQDIAKVKSRRLIVKLGEASMKRAPQVRAVARYIDRHQGERIILCGDFNDSPISYTHHILAKRLADCYVESGNGPGWSYRRNGIFVRIDNILCSSHWDAYQCKIDRKIAASDHQPISCWLKKR